MAKTEVQIPGQLTATYENGEIVGFTFSPHASFAGYFGPAAHVYDGDQDLEVEDTDGPFWEAIRTILKRSETFAVRWDE